MPESNSFSRQHNIKKLSFVENHYNFSNKKRKQLYFPEESYLGADYTLLLSEPIIRFEDTL